MGTRRTMKMKMEMAMVAEVWYFMDSADYLHNGLSGSAIRSFILTADSFYWTISECHVVACEEEDCSLLPINLQGTHAHTDKKL